MIPPAESTATPPPEQRGGDGVCGPGWSGRQLLWLAGLVFVAQWLFFMVLGEHHPTPPGPQPAGPHLQIARAGDDFIALADPSLFVLPHPNSPGSPVWQQPVAVVQPVHRFAPPPEFLSPAAGAPGSLTQAWAGPGVEDLTPAPPFAQPELVAGAVNGPSTLRVSGALAQRPMLAQPALPVLVANEVLPPSHVQVLVDPAGFVVSAVVLLPDNPFYAGVRPVLGDSTALQLARQLRFVPGPTPVVGDLYFRWQTRPTHSTP